MVLVLLASVYFICRVLIFVSLVPCVFASSCQPVLFQVFGSENYVSNIVGSVYFLRRGVHLNFVVMLRCSGVVWRCVSCIV